ncbi:hypothetical protein [Endozoicomonas sp. SCSIO W0465]|uniref:hypothetical protein n=1 Tax=Endozoicomonas sp. SCSIO W0465 TaxID=2918516 RepID=UPI002076396A|nr:hypothetical protein [Endozoicomonas sp. SCSIO W0465]USE34757.1 hypothetical protein MJO57_21885 [Endozoicomonas sp. SCSIO W0465]
MNMDYLPELLKGLGTTMELTLASLFTGLVLAILFTTVLSLKVRALTWLVKLQILLFTGTPLLIQIFLI